MSERQVWDVLTKLADAQLGASDDTDLASRRAMQAISFAAQDGARNLLDKARRALDEGDLDRASALIDRVAALAFDEHEQVWPAALAVHMDLFGVVTDALEGSAEDDARWLVAAVNALAAADERGACELRDVLVIIDQDYGISAAEHRQLSTAIASVPDRAGYRERELTPPLLRDYVTSVLHARRAYDRELAALRG